MIGETLEEELAGEEVYGVGTLDAPAGGGEGGVERRRSEGGRAPRGSSWGEVPRARFGFRVRAFYGTECGWNAKGAAPLGDWARAGGMVSAVVNRPGWMLLGSRLVGGRDG